MLIIPETNGRGWHPDFAYGLREMGKWLPRSWDVISRIREIGRWADKKNTNASEDKGMLVRWTKMADTQWIR